MVHYNYGTQGSIGDVLNRIDNIAASATPASADIHARYAYLGAGTIVRVSSQADGLTLDYDPAGNHTHAGWDRFGRVIDQKWTNATGTTTFDQYTYTYDIAGNRTTRTNALNAALTETYTYDELSRLIDTDRGEGEQQADFESWQLDQLGNWTTFCGPIQYTQTREHNEANEITSVSGGGPQPAYDAAGNTIYFGDARDSTPDSSTPGMNAVYDAWNRMTRVYADDGATVGQLDAGDAPIAIYEYDGQRRRIEKTVYDAGEAVATTGTYYNENWQTLEERSVELTSQPVNQSTTQFLWDLRYIDAPVLRWHDGNADGDLADAGDGVVYYVNDANWNVTALVDATTGAVVERYTYEPYGNQTVLEADWSADSDNTSDVGNGRGFSGAVRDAETGLVLMRWRYDHPQLGRFMTNDPAAYGQNLYGYCFSVPTLAVDPNGLEGAPSLGVPLPPDPSTPGHMNAPAYLIPPSSLLSGGASGHLLLAPAQYGNTSPYPRGTNGTDQSWGVGSYALYLGDPNSSLFSTASSPRTEDNYLPGWLQSLWRATRDCRSTRWDDGGPVVVSPEHRSSIVFDRTFTRPLRHFLADLGQYQSTGIHGGETVWEAIRRSDGLPPLDDPGEGTRTASALSVAARVDYLDQPRFLESHRELIVGRHTAAGAIPWLAERGAAVFDEATYGTNRVRLVVRRDGCNCIAMALSYTYDDKWRQAVWRQLTPQKADNIITLWTGFPPSMVIGA